MRYKPVDLAIEAGHRQQKSCDEMQEQQLKDDDLCQVPICLFGLRVDIEKVEHF